MEDEEELEQVEVKDPVEDLMKVSAEEVEVQVQERIDVEMKASRRKAKDLNRLSEGIGDLVKFPVAAMQ